MTVVDDQEVLRQRLVELQDEHRDLDSAIDALVQSGNFNSLQLQRLKKRKLILKDQIFVTQNALLPDIIA
ncbi:YdcH family protein [Sneathiella limimaris]|uniref:YdcH family protein n=1 Tax=Sneathiella limimaris TaxID=1964213 RepID=UPI00146E3561|nr:DUF465 domain-containing protein [Sneathiella limimaris]